MVNKGDHLLKWHGMEKGSIPYTAALGNFTKMTRQRVRAMQTHMPRSGSPQERLDPEPTGTGGEQEDDDDTSASAGPFRFMGPSDVSYKKWQRLIPAGFRPCK